MTSTEIDHAVGVLGGTFDPVHYGHLHVANALRAALGLQKVIWVPAGRPPHKSGQIVSRDRDRLAMLELALADSLNDEISTVDLDRSGPSYTADTLELLSAAVAPSRLVFLMGEDSLRDLPAWHDPERILQLAELAVAARPGIDTNLDAIAATVPGVKGRVHFVPTEELAISSSDIRRRVRAGQSIRGLVPPPVAAYVHDRGLYAPADRRVGLT